MQPRQMRETSRPVRPSLVYFIVYPIQLRASCEVRDDIRREEFVSLDVVPVIAVDQQVHTGVLILADQIDGLGHCAHKPPQRSALSQPLTLRRHSGLVAAEQPAVIVGRFNRSVVTLRGVAMLTKYRKLVPHRFRITADVAGIGQSSDRAQCKLLAAARDHHRRSRLLDRLRLEDRVLDMKISAVKSCSLLRPHREDKPDSLLHLPNAHRWPRREFPTILAVLRLEITGADAKRQPPPADQIDTGGDLGEMRGIAVADRCGERGEPNAAGPRRQRRQDSPAFRSAYRGRQLCFASRRRAKRFTVPASAWR